MSERTQRESRTGEFRRVEGEPAINREPIRPKSVPAADDGSASKTGVVPAYREPADETAKRDEDQPAQ
jgi:hypothetical protein